MNTPKSPDWAHTLVQRHANAARALEHMYTEKNIERLKAVSAELEAALCAPVVVTQDVAVPDARSAFEGFCEANEWPTDGEGGEPIWLSFKAGAKFGRAAAPQAPVADAVRADAVTEDELYAVEVALGIVKREWPEKKRTISGLQSIATRARTLLRDAEGLPIAVTQQPARASEAGEAVALTESQSRAIDAVCANLTPTQVVNLGDHIEALRSIQLKVAANGTFACPICGRTSPHQHTAQEQVAHRNIKKKIPDWHEGTLMEILETSGLRFKYRNEDVRWALIAGIQWGFDKGLAAAPAQQAVTMPDDARDAARYRWLRNNLHAQGRIGIYSDGWLDEQRLDAVTDAALQSNSRSEGDQRG